MSVKSVWWKAAKSKVNQSKKNLRKAIKALKDATEFLTQIEKKEAETKKQTKANNIIFRRKAREVARAYKKALKVCKETHRIVKYECKGHTEIWEIPNKDSYNLDAYFMECMERCLFTDEELKKRRWRRKVNMIANVACRNLTGNARLRVGRIIYALEKSVSESTFHYRSYTVCNCSNFISDETPKHKKGQPDPLCPDCMKRLEERARIEAIQKSINEVKIA